MQPVNQSKEISSLETEIDNLKKRLDHSIENSEEFTKTKSIFHDLKKLIDKLDKIKNLTENN
jgi:hypothetical protein